MLEVPESSIAAVYRPIADISWISEVSRYTSRLFRDAVKIDQNIDEFRVHLVPVKELAQAQWDPAANGQDLSAEVTAAMPQSYHAALSNVGVGKPMFIKPAAGNKRGLLLVKLDTRQALLDETDAAYEVLTPFGLVAGSSAQMQYGFRIGSMLYKAVQGKDKTEIYKAVREHIPQRLTLAAGKIALRGLRD